MTSPDQTTRSSWQHSSKPPSFPALEKNIETEVCVIGAGLAGCTTAYLLALEGKQVVLLESRDIGLGETGHTTAHITAVIDDRFSWLMRVHGEQNTQRATESQLAAMNRIETIVRKEHIDCDFQHVPGYLFNPPEEELINLANELLAAQKAGLADAVMLEKAPFQAVDTGPALMFPEQAQFHPLKYLYGLAQALKKLKVQIFTHSHVKNALEKNDKVMVTLANDRTVTADNIVVATNAPVIDNAIIYSNQSPYRTFVIALTIPKNSIPMALYWDTENPYHYVRRAGMTSGKNDLLIVGGEDHKTGQPDDGDDPFDALAKWTAKFFSDAGERVAQWSGQVLEPGDGLPLIGKKPGSDHTYIISGDSGMGMTNTTCGAMLVTDLLMNRKNPWAEIYDPMRFSMKASKEFIRENFNVAKTAIKDYITPGEVSSPSEVKKGAAALMRKGTKKIALYRDKKGALTALSAVCPHKGCIVHWNDAEQSWDCPCHGSRFDRFGSILNGPTLSPLDRVEVDE